MHEPKSRPAQISFRSICRKCMLYDTGIKLVTPTRVLGHWHKGNKVLCFILLSYFTWAVCLDAAVRSAGQGRGGGTWTNQAISSEVETDFIFFLFCFSQDIFFYFLVKWSGNTFEFIILYKYINIVVSNIFLYMYHYLDGYSNMDLPLHWPGH